MAKIVLVGTGNVGMSFAFSLVTSRNKVSELVLIDIRREKAEGEALDLIHAAVYNTNRVKVKAGDYSDCRDADIICICAGASQLPGETRRDLVQKNTKVFKSIIDSINKTGFKGIYLIATNPLDVMTQVTQRLSGLPHSRVIGSGTTLDTARLRFLIGDELSIHPRNIHSYVIGEHGDSSFIPWSVSRIGLNPLSGFLTPKQKDQMLHDMRNSAYEIIERKGSTHFGIGIMLKDIVEAILNDSKEIKTISVFCREHGIYMGMPAIIGREGVVQILSLELDKAEAKMLEASVRAIRETFDETGL